jgi:hypothetical protein
MSESKDSCSGICCLGMAIVGFLYILDSYDLVDTFQEAMKPVIAFLCSPAFVAIALIAVAASFFSYYSKKGIDETAKVQNDSMDASFDVEENPELQDFPDVTQLEQQRDIEEEQGKREEEEQRQREIQAQQRENEEKLRVEEEKRRRKEKERARLEELGRIQQENMQIFEEKLDDFDISGKELIKEYISKNERIFFDRKYQDTLQYIYEEHLKELKEIMEQKGFDFEFHEIGWLVERLRSEMTVDFKPDDD